MFDSLIGLIVVVAVIAVLARQNTRLKLLERELGALRSLVLSGAMVPQAAAPIAEAADNGSGEAQSIEAAPIEPNEAEAPAGPWQAAARTVATGVSPEDAPDDAVSAAAASSARPAREKQPDIETALGTRWAVWVGGVALALGGIFLIRYSIEAGIFGPGVRLTLAALLGLVLVASGELVRRTGFTGPVEGAAGAYVPAILTAAGAFTLFGAIYAAHALYGFIGPSAAFFLLGIVGVGTMGLALLHGQALAGVGLLGALATPALVASDAPNAWALFGYLSIVLVANTAVARLRFWVGPAVAGIVGIGLWCLLYLTGSGDPALNVVAFVLLVILAALAVVWLWGDHEARRQPDWPSVAAGAVVALMALGLIVDPVLATMGGPWRGVIVLAAAVSVALWRDRAIPLVVAAGVAIVLVHLRLALSGTLEMDFAGGELSVDGFAVPALTGQSLPIGAVLGLMMLGSGLWSALRLVASRPLHAGIWTFWAALSPLAVLVGLWVAFGDLNRDLPYAALAFALSAILTAGGEALARREHPMQAGGWSVTFAIAGAGLALVLALHMAFGPLLTTVLVGLGAVVPALATRLRSWPVLGWLCVGAAIVVLCRVAFDPTIVGQAFLGRTPVLNALLPGYGIPALAFGFCAWQLARTTDGRPRLAMEAAAALFALLAIAMLVRHAMNGGVIAGGAPTLAEQAIYTLIALGAGAILVAIDARSPSSVLRIGSLAAGVVSVAAVVAQHFIVLNPLFTDESTGRIPVFNLLLLAYLLPAIAAGALALYARGRRPRWYSAMLGLLASVLAFAYATLSVRRLFQGEHIALWAGTGQLETYAYSALWLAIGVGLLVIGVKWASQIVRIASGALIAIAVAKVFIYDMRELEGVLRALSFIGLGAVLIGIGLFYQRLLTRNAAGEAARMPGGT